MNTLRERLFDVPSMICERFGINHPVFYSYGTKGMVATPVKTYIANSNNLGNYLIDHGLKRKDYVVTIMNNSPDWNITEMGILQAGGIHVPLSPFYTSGQLKDILKLIRPARIFTSSKSTKKRIQSIIESLSINCCVENIKDNEPAHYKKSNNKLEDRKRSIHPEDTAVVLFTSGSTGLPKGSVLSHKNLLTSVKEFSGADFFKKCKRSISFLQMALSGERKVNYSCQINGISICYPTPHRDMLSNIKLFQPHITALVPFLLNELYSNIASNSQSLSLSNILCGGAAVPPKLIESYKAKGIDVFELYGLTETASLLAFNTKEFNKPGTVGKIARSVEVKFSRENEILAKGQNIMKGYLLKDNKLDAPLDNEGWFHTGDIGKIDQAGYLIITGRKKNAFKNSRGSYVYPDAIQQELMAHNTFEFVIITGDNADSLSAILKPKNSLIGSSKIRELIHLFNKNKHDELKISQFILLNGHTNDIFSASYKPDQRKIAELVNNNKFIQV